LKKKKHYNTQVTSVSSVIYDENWASKQTNSYTDWLNHIFFNSLGSNNSSGSQAGQVALGNSDVEGMHSPILNP
jgi:exopolysaccharide biosynthesis predicted pyruvyltransferase EpsI